jgi:copper chaperone CopZ
MSDADTVDTDLYQRAQALLEPGEIELVGLIVDSGIADDEPALHQATIEIGDLIAEHSGLDSTDTFVYSGTDDSEFGVNQHQGLTLEDEEFVWECQQLRRGETFEVVFYYEADVDQEGLVEAVNEAGYDAVGVEPE